MCWWTEERIRLAFLLNFTRRGRGLAGLIDDETSALMSLHLCLFIFGRKCCNRLSYIAHSYLACTYLTLHYLAARNTKKIPFFASLSVRSISILYYIISHVTFPFFRLSRHFNRSLSKLLSIYDRPLPISLPSTVPTNRLPPFRSDPISSSINSHCE